MLTLFVIFCHISNPTDCQTVMDIRGLHENRESCEFRANRLGADLMTATQGKLYPVRWKCMTKSEALEFLGKAPEHERT